MGQQEHSLYIFLNLYVLQVLSLYLIESNSAVGFEGLIFILQTEAADEQMYVKMIFYWILQLNEHRSGGWG